MKLNLISKSIIVGSLTVTSVYGIRYLQEPEKETSIAKSSSLKLSKLSSKNKPEDNRHKTKNMIFAKAKQVASVGEMESDTSLEEDEQEMSLEVETAKKGLSKVDFDKGLVSVEAKNANLIDVLIQVSSEAEIPINTESVDLEQRITIAMESVPIEKVLWKLLKGYDFYFLYGGHQGQLQAAKVYPIGTGGKIALIDPENASKALTEDDLYSSNPLDRALALQQYAASSGKDSSAQIKESLNDKEPDVRVTAILSAHENAIALPIETLKEIAELDASPLVRSAALSSLNMNTEISVDTLTELAESALDDSNETIREQAEAILEGLKETEDNDIEMSPHQQQEDEGQA